MAPPVLRPENALKRAEELISVGEEQAALQSLYDFITARRIRWAQPSLVEPIVFKFLELGVQLKRGRLIKDGLHQYKKLVQGSTEGLVSVGAVARKFIDLVETKMASEQAKEDEREDEDEDLEGGVTPENLLTSVYEQDQSVGGFNDEAITSWMRFSWESYRSVLDLLRNNSQLEITYSGVVTRSMLFCLNHNRKNEFKRLADVLRQHLDAANYQQSKYATNVVDLSDAATLKRYLDQRFQLVNVSVKLELWHEAFRAVEDVYHLMKMSKSAPKMSTLATYYENLAKVFFVSNDQLLHTIAYKKFYKLYLTNPKADEEQFKEYASRIFLSALSIKLDYLPLVGYDPQLRLYRLLNLESKPTRKEVIDSLLEDEMFFMVDEEIKQLYELVENNFDVSAIKDQLTVLLPKLLSKPYFQPYLESVRDVIVRRLLLKASAQYTSVSFEDLFSFLSLPEPMKISNWDIEKALLQAAVEDYVSFSIDHDSKTVTFVKDPFEAFVGAAPVVDEEEQEEEQQREDNLEVEDELDAIDGEENEEAQVEPEIIVTRNYYIRNKLSELSKFLSEVESYSESSYMEKIKLARENLIQQNKDAIERAKKAAEERTKKSLEQKQRYMADAALQAQQDGELKQQRIMEEKAAIEAKLAEDARRRLVEKKKRELQELKDKEAKRFIAEVNEKGHVYIDPTEAAKSDLKDLTQLVVKQLSKDKDELEEKINFALKRLDHNERALRKVELPLLQKEASALRDIDLKKYETMKSKIIETARAEHEAKLAEHSRLLSVYGDYKNIKQRLLEAHNVKFAEARKEMSAKLEAAKQARITEVRQKRYEEAVAKQRQEVAAAERQKRAKEQEEILRKQREVEEALERKAATSKTATRVPATTPVVQKSQADLDEVARKQREVEEALERKTASAPKRSGYIPPSQRASMQKSQSELDDIARKQREVEEALERKVSASKAMPRAMPSVAQKSQADLDEIARKQREVEEALEKKTAPAPKRTGYIPPSQRRRQ
ncbi:hypothetical protein KAFR_0C00300 [Kazachstania africana CBS 2517]|uniref:Eukaryotic translation initiation factor 3 subunit A n=1 Tax=Kazachstania africana (strain ATCC 22294 / BCRC 22015 / CBS 2517 / CECT 1963 / NBRC 1671 / NRRL Y-8276) TaxID=1071382 RepID=H2ARM6_KAZAF|nr:hypothetical protein KAFR_0C00300 [Kazachstania africana CBS 2517]CCF57026.1 hypothetical protein KAFR_0C00300 [Kazachstania africana CBS 2517]